MKPTPCPIKEKERQQLALLTKQFIKKGGRIDAQPIRKGRASTLGFNNSKLKTGRKPDKKQAWHDEITAIITSIKKRKSHG